MMSDYVKIHQLLTVAGLTIIVLCMVRERGYTISLCVGGALLVLAGIVWVVGILYKAAMSDASVNGLGPQDRPGP